MATGYQGYAGYDPERAKVDRARKLAEMLQEGVTSGPTNIWGGLSRIGQAWLAQDARKDADKAESTYSDGRKRIADTLISQMYPDAQGVANEQLAAPAPFDLTPGGVQQRQQQGGTGDKVRSLAELLGGDVMGAIDYTEKMKPPGPDYQFLQGPDGSIGRGDKTSGTFQQLQPGTPKAPDPVKMEQYTDATGQVWDRNPYTGESKKADVPRARVPQDGGNARGSLTDYQAITAQMKLDDVDRELQAVDEKARNSLATLDSSIALLDKFTGDTDKFNATYGNMMNPTGKKDDMFNWSISMDDNRKDGMAMLSQLGGQAFIDSIREMKSAGGAGSLSDAEGTKLAVAATRLMEVNQTDAAAKEAAADFKLRLTTFRAALEKDMATKRAAEVGRRQQMQVLMGSAAQQGPQPGAIEDGHRFRGGDPGDPSNWEPVQ